MLKTAVRFICLLIAFQLGCVDATRDVARIETLKIATYNIYFLDDGISEARRENLQRVLAELNADIIGFQEIDNEAALHNILSDDYQVAMLDDTSEVQDLALAVKKPLEVRSVRFAFPDTSLDEFFPRSRDLLEVKVGTATTELVVFIHHAKSRRGGRMETDIQREGASSAIVEYIRSHLAGKNVVLLGDFNDNPDDRSLNILESGDANAVGGMDRPDDIFLYNATEQLLDDDFCSYGYSYLNQDTAAVDTFVLRVDGARLENNKWRTKQHDYFRDVAVKAILFDQILVSPALRSSVREAGVFNKSFAVKGEPSRIRFGDSGLVYTNRGTLASDHVPVWITLELSQKRMQNAK